MNWMKSKEQSRKEAGHLPQPQSFAVPTEKIIGKQQMPQHPQSAEDVQQLKYDTSL